MATWLSRTLCVATVLLMPAFAQAATATVYSNATIVFNGGRAWTAQNANKLDSLVADTIDGSERSVFRVRSAENDADFDTPNKVRSELVSSIRIPKNVRVRGNYNVKLEGSTTASLEWLTIGQFHADDRVIGSPPFQWGVKSYPDGLEYWVFNVCYKRSADVALQYVTIKGPRFVRGVTHNVDVTFMDGYGVQSGYAAVSIDYAQAMTPYFGPMGFYAAAPNTTYMKVGQYGGVDIASFFPLGFDSTLTVTKLTFGLAL